MTQWTNQLFRSAVALGVLFLAGRCPEAVAATTVVQVMLYRSYLTGNAQPGQSILAIQRGPDGAAKSVCREGADASGFWECYLDASHGGILPGDSLDVSIGGAPLGKVTVPRMDVTGIVPGTDVIQGKISVPGSLDLDADHHRYPPAGGHASYSATLTTDAAGAFLVDTTGTYDVQADTFVELTVSWGVFRFWAGFTRPSISIRFGSSWTSIYPRKGGTYLVRLLDRAGRTRASDYVYLFEGQGGSARFVNSRGLIAIRPTDRIVVSGPVRLAVTVPAISLSVDAAQDIVSGRIPPGTTPLVEIAAQDDLGKSSYKYYTPTVGATGGFTLRVTPVDIRTGDYVRLIVTDAKGNTFEKSREVLAGL